MFNPFYPTQKQFFAEKQFSRIWECCSIKETKAHIHNTYIFIGIIEKNTFMVIKTYANFLIKIWKFPWLTKSQTFKACCGKHLWWNTSSRYSETLACACTAFEAQVCEPAMVLQGKRSFRLQMRICLYFILCQEFCTKLTR